MASYKPADFFDLLHFAHAAIFQDIFEIWEVLPKIKKYLSTIPLGKIEGEVAEGAILIHPEWISLGAGSKVEAGAYIVGPCVIGAECEVRQGAYLRGNLITGDRCVIGHATEVKNALFLNEVKASHFAYVGDSILGNRVNLGAGTKCANLRFDKKEIQILEEGRFVKSGLTKFGVIMGDDAQTGCNAVTNPGTIMGKKSMVGPCMSVRGVIPHGGIAKMADPLLLTSP